MDIECLLSLVSENRELFDKAHKDYKNADKKELLWQGIAQKMGIDADEVKSKWKNLRDTYTRKKREDQDECRSGQAAKKKKSWKFMKVMEFLASSTEPRSVHSNIEEYAEVEDGSESETSFSTSGGSTPSEPVKSTSKKRKRPDTPDFVERYLAAREARDREREERRDQRREDDIGLFLQSLAPVIRRLPPAKQSSVKMRFHQILHEAEYGHSEVLHPQLPVQSPVPFHRAPPQTPPQYERSGGSWFTL